MTHIIVLGAGLGGITQAYELRQALSDKARITVVSDLPYFEFTVSNPRVAVGWREPSDMRMDLAAALGRNGLNFIGKAAAKVRPEQNRIELADGENVDYDYLVIATGSAPASDEIPGLGPHGGCTRSVCKTDHARQAMDDFEKLVADPGSVVVIDDYQRNPAYPNVYAIGVCVAIPPVGPTTVPLGAPKTGYMIESMATAATHNTADAVTGREPSHRATWNAVCLADSGDRGVAFVALPRIPLRNSNWSGDGKWVHLARVAFEKYFLRKVRRGQTEPVYEPLVMGLLGVDKLRQPS